MLDEPTAALAPASSTLVFETLCEVNRSAGITVVVIEQKVALLSEYCSRVVVLDQGKLVFDDTPRKVFSHGERLREIGVDSPRVARVSNSLAAAGLCELGKPALSVDEAAAQHLCEIFENCCRFDLRFWDMVYTMGQQCAPLCSGEA